MERDVFEQREVLFDLASALVKELEKVDAEIDTEDHGRTSLINGAKAQLKEIKTKINK